MATLTPFGVVTTRGCPSPTPSASSARASSGYRGSVGGTGMRSAGGVASAPGVAQTANAAAKAPFLRHRPTRWRCCAEHTAFDGRGRNSVGSKFGL